MSKVNEEIMSPFNKAIRDIRYPFLMKDDAEMVRGNRKLDFKRINKAFIELDDEYFKKTKDRLNAYQYRSFAMGYDKALEDMGE